MSTKESKYSNMNIYLPLSYYEYSIEGPIRPGVYYYFQFIVESICNYGDQKILLQGTIIFEGQKHSKSIVHSLKLRPMFFAYKSSKKLLHFVGKLDEEIIFFPSMRKLTSNFIEPSYSHKPNLKFIDNLPKEMQEPLRQIHFPESIDNVNNALMTLYQYETSAIYHTIKPSYRKPYSINPTYTLPFVLSKEQKQIVDSIFEKLSSDIPLCAMVHGDVGCGKTIIGYLAALKVIANGFKVLFLTPNLLLANQVYTVFKQLGANCSLFTSQTKSKDGDIIIGTQALLFQEFHGIGLVIIDEQHKFGTLQRQHLANNCDLLMLSATPIPRTHHLAQMGKIQQFHLTNRSNNLKPYVIHRKNRQSILERILKQIGKRIVWICRTVQLAQEMYTYLNSIHEFNKDFNIWFIHGKLKEKQEILNDFAKNYGILISTTVIEVGVDLDIHIIVIDDADKFGLAQLHQLKGRAGRHTYLSQCIFIGDNLDKLKHIKEHHTGSMISDLDLETRGAGSTHQKNQSGKTFLFNKIVKNYKFYDNPQIPNPIEVSAELIDFFMTSKSYI